MGRHGTAIRVGKARAVRIMVRRLMRAKIVGGVYRL